MFDHRRGAVPGRRVQRLPIARRNPTRSARPEQKTRETRGAPVQQSEKPSRTLVGKKSVNATWADMRKRQINVGWFEEYRCGCVSDVVKRKKDLPGCCGAHGDNWRGRFKSAIGVAVQTEKE